MHWPFFGGLLFLWDHLHIQCRVCKFYVPIVTSTWGARFSKALETFRAGKAIFNSSVSKNGEVYAPETSCMKGTFVHIKTMWIKHLCSRHKRYCPPVPKNCLLFAVKRSRSSLLWNSNNKNIKKRNETHRFWAKISTNTSLDLNLKMWLWVCNGPDCQESRKDYFGLGKPWQNLWLYDYI